MMISKCRWQLLGSVEHRHRDLTRLFSVGVNVGQFYVSSTWVQYTGIHSYINLGLMLMYGQIWGNHLYSEV